MGYQASLFFHRNLTEDASVIEILLCLFEKQFCDISILPGAIKRAIDAGGQAIEQLSFVLSFLSRESPDENQLSRTLELYPQRIPAGFSLPKYLLLNSLQEDRWIAPFDYTFREGFCLPIILPSFRQEVIDVSLNGMFLFCLTLDYCKQGEEFLSDIPENIPTGYFDPYYRRDNQIYYMPVQWLPYEIVISNRVSVPVGNGYWEPDSSFVSVPHLWAYPSVSSEYDLRMLGSGEIIVMDSPLIAGRIEDHEKPEIAFMPPPDFPNCSREIGEPYAYVDTMYARGANLPFRFYNPELINGRTSGILPINEKIGGHSQKILLPIILVEGGTLAGKGLFPFSLGTSNRGFLSIAEKLLTSGEETLLFSKKEK